MRQSAVIVHSRFNEAAALLPREGGVVLDTGLLPSMASMRPRHYCRGRGIRRTAPAPADRCASMRPRHYCRGRAPSAHGTMRRFRELQ
ncbi:hypothetical protein DF3PA_250025 [Candidatus Defluviicoccus seviourii]|uniref:Uncharacterized protein n=1 Tax=Candidatus Defluviicoccus seviourii TaxID=2565273 RepID=A0A564WDN3_9PROT|nr:hypothetical protein DF3PA_250025 [Candidatus Defluviicoccus seviourii]